MSTDDSDSEEWGLTDEDRRRMGEWTDSTGDGYTDPRADSRPDPVQHGVPYGTDLAIEHAPEDFGTGRLFVAAWLFEHGASTAPAVMEGTGLSPGTIYPTLNRLVDEGACHVDHVAELSGNGRHPKVYVPDADVVMDE